MASTQLAKSVHDVANIKGEFLLRSGVTSNEYFDKYLFEAKPALLKDITQAMQALVPDGIDLLAGLEMGGIPIVTMLAQWTGQATLFVRKDAKAYGTCKLAEGGQVEGQRLLIVEDVVTSGGQIIISTKQLRELGATVDTAICVIDREAGGREKLAAEGIELRALFTMTELKQAAGIA